MGSETDKLREGHYRTRMPRWLHRPIRSGGNIREVDYILRSLELNTVCESARCPNRMECFSRRTATFMIMGDTCTRNCAFCSVRKGEPSPLDEGEPGRVAEAATVMGLRHVVVTSVTRDDLPDGGAAHFAETIKSIKDILPAASVEVLTPDFGGDGDALARVLERGPEVFNHNLETVESLYSRVRPEAAYRRSLGVLRLVRELNAEAKTKSGLMVGLGESREQLRRAFEDLAEAGCEMLTIGQYLRPSRDQIEVDRFLPPEEFEELKREAEKEGILLVASGPFVRSSYRAKELLDMM
ncbi:MAG: lipoyl synthase [Actinomycetota bacterium]|nr:lipoyl synthase [Actinomycetota bacterium]